MLKKRPADAAEMGGGYAPIARPKGQLHTLASLDGRTTSAKRARALAEAFELEIGGSRPPQSKTQQREWRCPPYGRRRWKFGNDVANALRPYHSPARTRIIAGLSGFLTLSQSRDDPDR
jgi:hypothetical protein